MTEKGGAPMKRMIALILLASVLLAGCAGRGTDQPEETKKNMGYHDTDPKEDTALNILFVSNSTCYYFPDELLGVLTAAGYKDVTLAVTYYSGCSIQKHHDWYQENASNYEFRVWSTAGNQSYPNYSLENALYYKNWDVVSFDNNSRSFSSFDVQTSIEQAEPAFGELLGMIKEKLPNARYFWHEYWAEGIGYNGSFAMESVDQRTRNYQVKNAVMHAMAEKYNLEMVPTGTAWEKVRDLPLITTPIEGIPNVERFTLFSRLKSHQFVEDFVHDGDIGGGQYLNACVWLEAVTGQSCIGNTFRPKYTMGTLDCSLSEEKIEVLQNAAHEAVEELKKG